jgi:hypothetical protein
VGLGGVEGEGARARTVGRHDGPTGRIEGGGLEVVAEGEAGAGIGGGGVARGGVASGGVFSGGVGGGGVARRIAGVERARVVGVGIGRVRVGGAGGGVTGEQEQAGEADQGDLRRV